MRANTLTPFDSSAAVSRSSVVAKSCELCSVTSPSSGTANILVGAEQRPRAFNHAHAILQVFAYHAEEPHLTGSCNSGTPALVSCPGRVQRDPDPGHTMEIQDRSDFAV